MYSYEHLIIDTKRLNLQFVVIPDENKSRVVLILSEKTIIIHQYETHENSCIESHFVSEIEYRTKTEANFIFDMLSQFDYEKFSLDKY